MSIEIGSKWVKDGEVVEVRELHMETFLQKTIVLT